MSPLPTPSQLAELMAFVQGPCLSLYQQTLSAPTHRERNPLRFEALWRDLERLLGLRYPKANHQRLMAPYVALGHDEAFWEQTGAGLAVLGATHFVRVFVLPYPVADLAVVGSRFHVLPIAPPRSERFRSVNGPDRRQPQRGLPEDRARR